MTGQPIRQDMPDTPGNLPADDGHPLYGAEENTPGGSPMPRRQRWPVGTVEMAVMFGVAQDTTFKWRTRSAQGRMHPPIPDPAGVLNGGPFWWDDTLERWGAASGRPVRFWPVNGQALPVPDRVTRKPRKAPAPVAVPPDPPEAADGALAAGNGTPTAEPTPASRVVGSTTGLDLVFRDPELATAR